MKIYSRVLIFCIGYFFQNNACQSGELTKYNSAEKSYPKNVLLYAQMYRLPEQEVSQKLHCDFPFFSERIDVKLNVATQAGNAEEVYNILDNTSYQLITVRVLRTALLFAHETCEYPGSQEFMPIGPREEIVPILCQRLLSHLRYIERHMF